MSLRRLILATQFLTRLPTPQVGEFQPQELNRCAVYFPFVGAFIGTLLALPLLGVEHRPWLAAVLALLAWVWVTGALHLDGLADVADAFGAAHRNPERFMEVLRDPHTGVFGVVAIVMQLLLKLVLLSELAGGRWAWGIVLVPAWARWATLWWSRHLPPLQPGLAERFSWQLGMPGVWLWAVVLALPTLWLAPPLLLALPLAPLIALYWRRRLGGISGDCLGASTEVMESLLLLALVALVRG
ncbi:adenosylcobinamide-GDP ribazoletransferase [Lysobacter sp. GX 14042]|uniref:adenosylcobinamide-GDP ribazoletransferase n=1 Tax=Lysobacter sp. GX 14042 TaxID=2907155 RepID=UPI001F1674EC|nr:adenosylcobinamide-GDP ribazoletransferase [Lysobacter sp. GX 14042]MCE7033085.1 adenosylcobinamide-GDP ribazoletransferase [Lysobacter sp. GX 14042]